MQGRWGGWGREKALKFGECTPNLFCAYKLRSQITVTGGWRQSCGKAGEPYGQRDTGRDEGRGLISVLPFSVSLCAASPAGAACARAFTWLCETALLPVRGKGTLFLGMWKFKPRRARSSPWSSCSSWLMYKGVHVRWILWRAGKENDLLAHTRGIRSGGAVGYWICLTEVYNRARWQPGLQAHCSLFLFLL